MKLKKDEWMDACDLHHNMKFAHCVSVLNWKQQMHIIKDRNYN